VERPLLAGRANSRDARSPQGPVELAKNAARVEVAAERLAGEDEPVVGRLPASPHHSPRSVTTSGARRTSRASLFFVAPRFPADSFLRGPRPLARTQLANGVATGVAVEDRGLQAGAENTQVLAPRRVGDSLVSHRRGEALDVLHRQPTDGLAAERPDCFSDRRAVRADGVRWKLEAVEPTERPCVEADLLLRHVAVVIDLTAGEGLRPFVVRTAPGLSRTATLSGSRFIERPSNVQRSAPRTVWLSPAKVAQRALSASSPLSYPRPRGTRQLLLPRSNLERVRGWSGLPCGAARA
jgi:hypothetical protein